MKSVAEHATLELSSELDSKVHYTLSYLESQDQQVGEYLDISHIIDHMQC